MQETTLYTFADDTAILATYEDPKTAHSMLQQHLLQTEEWLNTWKIKVNADKCKHYIHIKERNCPAYRVKQRNRFPN